jgi:hypothetical protein
MKRKNENKSKLFIYAAKAKKVGRFPGHLKVRK